MSRNHPHRDKLRRSHTDLMLAVEHVVFHAAEILRPGASVALVMLRLVLAGARAVDRPDEETAEERSARLWGVMTEARERVLAAQAYRKAVAEPDPQ